MYPLTRTIFLTLGSCMLFLMVFLGAALHFDVLPFEYLVSDITQFVFIGYTIPEILGMGKIASYKELTVTLKLVLVIGGLFASFYLIGISFLSSSRLQFKALSFGISIPLFLLLFQFWTSFVNDDRILLREDKLTLFSCTLIVYLISVLLMWYGLHVRRVSPTYDMRSSISPIRLHAIQNSIPSAEELSSEANDKGFTGKTETDDALGEREQEEGGQLRDGGEEGLAEEVAQKEVSSGNLGEEMSKTGEVDREEPEHLNDDHDLIESKSDADPVDEKNSEFDQEGNFEVQETDVPGTAS
jgi:hypothetical protein